MVGDTCRVRRCKVCGAWLPSFNQDNVCYLCEEKKEFLSPLRTNLLRVLCSPTVEGEVLKAKKISLSQ